MRVGTLKADGIGEQGIQVPTFNQCRADFAVINAIIVSFQFAEIFDIVIAIQNRLIVFLMVDQEKEDTDLVQDPGEIGLFRFCIAGQIRKFLRQVGTNQ